ncbi:RNA-guided endonuclease InsQ/TnpB family protein [Methanohalobium evestigatum]|nr:RNA-guided endonuclease TnpB family protein [Methanohalobium evestigatum]
MSFRNKDKFKNTVTFTLKQEIYFSGEDENILDGQSKICNWLYNYLYDMVEYDYKYNGSRNKLINKYNLRNQVPRLKEEKPFLKTVYSSVLKNVAIRLAKSYENFFQIPEVGHPQHRSWKTKWFSLEYEEKIGWKIDGKTVIISLGKDKYSKQLKVVGTLNEKPKLDGGEPRAFRLVKQRGKFYAILTVVKDKTPKKDVEKWIALDPNHKNLLTAYDYKGNTIEFQNLDEIKYWDGVIDDLMSKRDNCKRKSQFIPISETRGYWEPSNNWKRYDKALEKALHTKREQTKLGMFTIANYLCRNYDKILIGDYTPSKEVSPHKKANRSILNQTLIAKLRGTIEWVCDKSGKTFKKVDEKNTTKKCCICEDVEKKDPEVRTFTCKKCGQTLSRDINSAVNIAKKEMHLSGTDYKANLKEPLYIAYWRYNNSKINMQTN